MRSHIVYFYTPCDDSELTDYEHALLVRIARWLSLASSWVRHYTLLTSRNDVCEFVHAVCANSWVRHYTLFTSQNDVCVFVHAVCASSWVCHYTQFTSWNTHTLHAPTRTHAHRNARWRTANEMYVRKYIQLMKWIWIIINFLVSYLLVYAC